MTFQEKLYNLPGANYLEIVKEIGNLCGQQAGNNLRYRGRISDTTLFRVDDVDFTIRSNSNMVQIEFLSELPHTEAKSKLEGLLNRSLEKPQ